MYLYNEFIIICIFFGGVGTAVMNLSIVKEMNVENNNTAYIYNAKFK